MGNLQIKPQRVVVQLNDCLMAAFFSVWLDYDKPCILTVTPSGKALGLVGIGFTVDNDKTLEFMSKKEYRRQTLEFDKVGSCLESPVFRMG